MDVLHGLAGWFGRAGRQARLVCRAGRQARRGLKPEAGERLRERQARGSR